MFLLPSNHAFERIEDSCLVCIQHEVSSFSTSQTGHGASYTLSWVSWITVYIPCICIYYIFLWYIYISTHYVTIEFSEAAAVGAWVRCCFEKFSDSGNIWWWMWDWWLLLLLLLSRVPQQGSAISDEDLSKQPQRIRVDLLAPYVACSK